MSLKGFHPLIGQWFSSRFQQLTEAQRLAWPHIAERRHTLIAAPTGSGKTLAAFLVSLDELCRQWFDGRLEEGIQTIYVSPLRALSNDIERNLQVPLGEIRELATQAGHEPLPIRATVRTGDTPASQRQAMLRRAPHILVTTPESLYLLLTSKKSRKLLRTARTVIVDEIHALARDKRGSHLSLSLERLTALAEQPLQRIGLSATQRPIDDIARFLVGSGCEKVHLANSSMSTSPSAAKPPVTLACAAEPPAGGADVAVVDVGHVRELDLAIVTPPSELSAVCSHEQWDEIYDQLIEHIKTHRSTLIFVNTRRLAERVCHRLAEVLGEDAVASHHGSLSRSLRLSAEQRLKNGQLRAIVATASLEMGIDIGYIDLVCQIGSPRSLATFVQRIGRSGHSLGAVPRGRLFPLTRDELLECMALIRAVHRGELDRTEIPVAPLDILAQQIVAAVACEDWSEDELYALVRRAWPYRNLQREDFDRVVTMLSEGLTHTTRRGQYLHRDRIHHRLRARRNARLAAVTSGGAIPETADYRVVAEPEKTFVGTLDEDFAIESLSGDVFLLGNTSWRIQYVRGGEVVVRDAEGAAPTIPFWFGEAPGRTIELSEEISQLRQDVASAIGAVRQAHGDSNTVPALSTVAVDWLQEQCGVDRRGATQAASYIEAQLAAVGVVPTGRQILFERFFDESGGMQLVIHSPLGARINRAWGLALRKRFCRSFDFELQAAATDDGILLSIGPQHSFPIESLFKMLGTHNARHLLEQAVLAAPMFQVRWRWNLTRALAVLRNQAGKKVPPHLQRFRSDDLLAATFPETVGCLENHHGDVEIPDHPLVYQTMYDCLHEAMDFDRWHDLLGEIKTGQVQLLPRDTREPSPFSYEILNANPYAFLDDAPLEERRTRAVSTRRSIRAEDVQDLAQLDAAAVAQVRREAAPVVRDAEELHDALSSMVVAAETDHWWEWFDRLVSQGRATTVQLDGGRAFWIAAESWPAMETVYAGCRADPAVELPESLRSAGTRADELVRLIRGQMQFCGPTTATELAAQLALDPAEVHSALEALEGQGTVLRGHFSQRQSHDADEVQWCDRRLLARIHRLTLQGLRQQIKPVSPEAFMRFLVHRHRLGEQKWRGPVGVREAVAQLQGFDLPAGSWEDHILAPRVSDYDPQWLDQLFLGGEVAWGRLRPPRQEENGRKASASINRTVPISLLLRSDLQWLVDREREGSVDAEGNLSAAAQQVLETLTAHGALFLQDLASVTQLLAGHLEEALRELSARGLVTSDAFAAVREIITRRSSLVARRGAVPGTGSPAGRWSRFPGYHAGCSREEHVENWCRQLLRRYGVLFRDLLARETAAPSWRELVSVLRRMELRGEVRGGRFVDRVAGEQYADESAVESLRAAREAPADSSWIVLSAADPLNLTGIVLDGTRVAATHGNRLILQDGRRVAAVQARCIEFYEEFNPETCAEMGRALQTGRRHSRTHLKPSWTASSQPGRSASAEHSPSSSLRDL